MKQAKFMAFMLIGVVAAASLTSCGDDDEPVIDNPGGEIVTPDNQKLVVTSMGGHKLLYNSNGLFAGVDNEFKVDYAANTITGIGQEADPFESVTFSYDSNGYVTNLTRVERGADNSYVEETKYVFAYDRTGHLVKVTASGEGSEVDEGVPESWVSAMEMDLVWENGRLLSSTAMFNTVENGLVDKETYTFSFTNGDNNPLLQTSAGYAIVFSELDDDFAWMAIGGMLGAAPAQFPRMVTVTHNDDDGEHRATYTFDYKFARNLTIDTETIAGTVYKYTYSPVGSSAAGTKLFEGMRKAGRLR